MFRNRFAAAGLAGCLLSLASGVARGDTDASSPAPGMQAPSASHARWFRGPMGGPGTRLDSEATAAADVTPPVLTAIDAATTLNVGKATPLFSVVVKGSDDLSGIRRVLFFARGPSDQRIFGQVVTDYPATSLNRRVAFAFFYSGRLLQPGTWSIEEAQVYDVAGNEEDYFQPALATLGNTSFTVVNAGTYDAVAPTLTSGQILTPAVSLSATAKGTTNQAPFAGVKLAAADAGSTAVAGLAGAVAVFCLADESRCLELWATHNGGSQATGTLLAGSQVSPVLGHAAGEYLLYEVVLWDQAGNFRELLSTAFGGTTNFSTLFPTTKITLKP